LVLPYSSALNERGPSICHPCHETNHRATIAMPTDADYDITQIAVTPMGLVSQYQNKPERSYFVQTHLFFHEFIISFGHKTHLNVQSIILQS